MIRHYIFDIGKVILTFDFGLSASRLAPWCRLPEAEILPALQSLQIGLETGRITTEEFVEAGGERIGYRGTPDAFVHAFQDIFTLNEPIDALVRGLSDAGLPLYLLSNTSELHVSWFTERYEVFGRFADAVYSHEAGCMKPDPEIYHHARTRFGIDPGESLYVDDLPANVEAARDAGFHSLVYDHTDHPAFLERFRDLTGFTG